ncbi:hypothetical protein MSIMFB_01748 [Mycobacterium simulans]|uniref:Diacylglycerol O-acyltransferase n=1 Tax=Mycobacterium simulans TaxID=627089 RepID=A0A7Z7IIR8_9MYCO|nr:hypothetical protein [Mycobacterium simulans]SOJ54249.1 hypothetical protein MSIMFB_01748 [Mycobacterium simulans]
MDNILDLYDQAMFLGERATGATSLIQFIWVYNRAIDVDGLRQFHHQLQRGRLARRIERSPLPFGRHRWVFRAESYDIETVATPRPRAEFDDWLNKQANTVLDAEHGPGWHLAVLPFADGGAGVSFVITHCLTDGLGLCEALADATCGRQGPISWPAAESRPRWQALHQDARQLARDVPSVGRAVTAAAKLARRNRIHYKSAAALAANSARPPVGSDRPITIPTETMFLSTDQWDAVAHSLGGSSNTLLAGIAARLAERIGRVSADGTITLSIPVNQRIDADTRANALSNIDISVDAASAWKDLRDIRAATKQALIRHQEVPDERWTLLPLVPMLPKRLFRRMVGVVGSSTTTIASNVGAFNPAVNRADGTDADYFAMRSLYPGVTETTMYRTGGVLALASGRVHGHVFVSVIGYQPGGRNTNDRLRQALLGTLDDFSLTPTTGWPRNEQCTLSHKCP